MSVNFWQHYIDDNPSKLQVGVAYLRHFMSVTNTIQCLNKVILCQLTMLTYLFLWWKHVSVDTRYWSGGNPV